MMKTSHRIYLVESQKRILIQAWAYTSYGKEEQHKNLISNVSGRRDAMPP
jgi:hypothetical protein